MKAFLLSFTIALSACASVEPLRPDMASRVLPSRLDEIAYINSLREAFVITPVSDGRCYDGANLRYFRARFGQGYPEHTAEQETLPSLTAACVQYRDIAGMAVAQRRPIVRRYLEAGFGLTDLYCQRYFIVAAESAQRRRFQRNSGATVDTLVNAVLGVANAGETALAVANAGFEGYDSTFQNIEDAFMVAPDLANVRDLVHAAQQEFRKEAFKNENLPDTFEGSRSVLERYAGLCSYSGMRQLVNDSVTTATRTLNDQARPPASPNGTENRRNNVGTITAAPQTDASVPVPVTAPQR